MVFLTCVNYDTGSDKTETRATSGQNGALAASTSRTMDPDFITFDTCTAYSSQIRRPAQASSLTYFRYLLETKIAFIKIVSRSFCRNQPLPGEYGRVSSSLQP